MNNNVFKIIEQINKYESLCDLDYLKYGPLIEPNISIEHILNNIKLVENDVNKILQERDQLYNKLKSHGHKHINDVVLFSSLIALEKKLDKESTKLLLIASLYHDCGRTTDGNDDHALLGASIALDKLRDKLNSNDLKIVLIAIEFHEVSRIDPTIEDNEFIKICQKYQVDPNERIRNIADILKDADALDRTRFINRARLKANLLKNDEAKQLIKFACRINTTYALEELNEYNIPDIISSLLTKYTPLYLTRLIHKNKLSYTEVIGYFKSMQYNEIKKEEEYENKI